MNGVTRVHDGLKHWRYRAYNDQLKIVQGVAKANSFPELALYLRQNLFLCILSAETIDAGTYEAERRLQQMQRPSS